MSAETQARMFEPFFSTKFTGRGLGLAAVLGILRGHCGAVRVHSESGQGTMMRLFLPARDQARAIAAADGKKASTRGRVPAPALAPAPAPAIGGGLSPDAFSGSVLVIDDEDTVRSVAQTILERVGFTVVTAANGADGIARFREADGKFCVVLLDMNLPLVSSLQVHEELTHVRPDVRVVLSSGYMNDETIAPFDSKRIAGYLQKPYRFEELIACVRQAAGVGSGGGAVMSP
jgi:CheY-like chemotaxis protein